MTLPRPKTLTIFLALFTGITAGYGTFNTSAAAGASGTPIQIASDPPGADLYIMGKHAGTTPMTISDQDIYPVNYEAATEKFYGMVFLLKDGCEDYSRRLTRSDISNGLTAELVCGAEKAVAASLQAKAPVEQATTPATVTTTQSATQTTATTAVATAVPAPAPQPQSSQESLYERRLKQLKSLQQLLDDGLISAEEEERLRRRIIDAL